MFVAHTSSAEGVETEWEKNGSCILTATRADADHWRVSAESEKLRLAIVITQNEYVMSLHNDLNFMLSNTEAVRFFIFVCLFWLARCLICNSKCTMSSVHVYRWRRCGAVQRWLSAVVNQCCNANIDSLDAKHRKSICFSNFQCVHNSNLSVARCRLAQVVCCCQLLHLSCTNGCPFTQT